MGSGSILLDAAGRDSLSSPRVFAARLNEETLSVWVSCHSNLALIVYLFEQSSVINKMMFSHLEKSELLKLFSLGNTLKSGRFIDY